MEQPADGALLQTGAQMSAVRQWDYYNYQGPVWALRVADSW